MQVPVRIIQAGPEKVNRTEETRDISSGGICFLSHREVEVGGRIEYLITLSSGNPPVRIRCFGKVLRSREQARNEVPFEVAVTMERYRFMSLQEGESLAVAS
jgi:hypothetical protein